MTTSHNHDPAAAARAGDSRSGESINLEAQVRAEQAALVFERARASNLVAPLLGALVCWALWDAVGHGVLAAWLAATMLTMAWREWSFQGFARGDRADAVLWGRRHELALLANATVLGMIGTLLLPAGEPAVAAIMLSTLVGIAAIGVVVLSASLRASLALAFPVLLPTIVTQLALGTRLSVYVALAMTLFLVLAAVEGRKASQHTLAMLRLRFRMDELATQREQALDLAHRSNAVKGQFMATMSHEMRTPLHGILGVTRLLRTPPPGTDAQTETDRLEMIERTGEHLLHLINDVLDFSKIEGGHLTLTDGDFDLAALVQSVADLTGVSAAEKGLRLTISFAPPSPCWVRADASRLQQVLLNLSGNAVKFTEAGSVEIAVHRVEGGATTFVVTDTGPGVAPEQRPLIFEAFHQADGSYGRRHGGTGLGLTIARELAHAMGGDLVCDADLTVGARFILTLPLPGAEPVAAPPRPVTETLTLRGRVLVAEDNPVNALLIEALLLRAGLTVDLVENGARAVEQAATTRYDLILMDCQMPGMDGFDATARIRRHEVIAATPAVPIVALTANALESDRQRSLAAGMNDHLAKPFRDQELNEVLRRFMP